MLHRGTTRPLFRLGLALLLMASPACKRAPYTAPDGSFSVQFKGTPKLVHVSPTSSEPFARTVFLLSTFDLSSAALVGIVDITPELRTELSEEDLLDAVLTDQAPYGQPPAPHPVAAGGHPGLEVSYRTAAARVSIPLGLQTVDVTVRAFIAGNRLYYAEALRAAGSLPEEDVAAFLDTFRINTPPRPAVAGASPPERGGGAAQSPPELPAGAHLYVLDRGNDRIVRMDDMTGAGWTTFGARGHGTGEFMAPAQLAVDKGGRIYVADTLNHRIVQLRSMLGEGWTEFPPPPEGDEPREGEPGEDLAFRGPSGIAIDSFGRIFVSDQDNDRLVRMDDLKGTGWTTFGEKRLKRPGALFIDRQNRLFVVDEGHSRIVRIDDMTGKGWTTFGVPSLGDLGGPKDGPEAAAAVLHGPEGVCADAEGRIYIAVTQSHRIVRIDAMDGSGAAMLGDFRHFCAPSGVFVDDAQHIYATDECGRISRMDDMRGTHWRTLGTLGEKLSGVRHFNHPAALFVR